MKRIVIFSSVEGLRLAQYVQKNFYAMEYKVKLWTNGFFKLSEYYLSNFRTVEKEFDLALFIVTSDDVVYYRNKKEIKPREIFFLKWAYVLGSLA